MNASRVLNFLAKIIGEIFANPFCMIPLTPCLVAIPVVNLSIRYLVDIDGLFALNMKCYSVIAPGLFREIRVISTVAHGESMKILKSMIVINNIIVLYFIFRIIFVFLYKNRVDVKLKNWQLVIGTILFSCMYFSLYYIGALNFPPPYERRYNFSDSTYFYILYVCLQSIIVFLLASCVVMCVARVVKSIKN